MKFNRSILNPKITALVIGILSVVLYFLWGYELARFEHKKLILIYSLLFGGYYFVLKHSNTEDNWLNAFAVLFRLIFLFSLPTLSQDFYRFIWDGRLILEGLNPYLYTPNELIVSSPELFSEMNTLHNGMGRLSAKYFSNYPPIHQIPFILASLIFKKNIFGSVVVIRIILIIADLGILIYTKKLLKKLKLPIRSVYWFILNPLVIIELTGNLHFEGLMLCFFIMALYFIHSKKWHIASITMALSVAVKLIPVLSLPLVVNKLGWKKSIVFYITTGCVIVILFLPFLSLDFLENYSATIGLWFSNFEFNASIYYLLKWALTKVEGLKFINSMGAVVAFVLTIQASYQLLHKKKKTEDLLYMIFWIICSYYFLSTTVHPWYITSLLMLSIFTKFKFVILWSYTLIFSYFAYGEFDVKESSLWLSVEYIPVVLMLLWELYFRKKLKHH